MSGMNDLPPLERGSEGAAAIAPDQAETAWPADSALGRWEAQARALTSRLGMARETLAQVLHLVQTTVARSGSASLTPADVHRLAERAALDLVRRQRARGVDDADPFARRGPWSPPPEPSAAANTAFTALERLPDPQRIATRLHLAGWTRADASQLLDRPESQLARQLETGLRAVHAPLTGAPELDVEGGVEAGLRALHAESLRAREPETRWACPSTERLFALASGRVPAEERVPLLEHVCTCAACAREFALLRAVAVHVGGAPSGWRRPALLVALGLIAIAAVVKLRPPTPPVPAEALAPGDSGAMAQTPELAWHPVAGAARYQVSLEAENGVVVWQGETGDTALRPPATLVQDTASAAKWQVVAVLVGGQRQPAELTRTASKPTP